MRFCSWGRFEVRSTPRPMTRRMWEEGDKAQGFSTSQSEVGDGQKMSLLADKPGRP